MIAELKNISKSYPGGGAGNDTGVLIDISLCIHKNETIAILGPSGSGKSTLLNIIGTLDKASSGTLLLNGTDVETLDARALADLRSLFTGHVFQLHYLLPQLSLLENVLLPAMALKDKSLQDAALEHAMQLIDRVGLMDRLHHRPAELSVGECQRVAVVRALINKPKLLLADEPTGSLDAGNAQDLGKLLVELSREQETSAVVVTHSPDLAAGMDNIYRLVSGRLQLQEKA